MDLRSFANAGVFFLSGVTVLLIHVIIMFLVAKLMKVDLCTLGIASIANIGGVSSAPVVAAAVVVGYGTQQKKDITGSVAVIDTEELLASSGSSATQQLQGKAAGVNKSGFSNKGCQAEKCIGGIERYQ